MKQHYKKLIEIFKGGWESVQEDLWPMTVVTWLVTVIQFMVFFIALTCERVRITDYDFNPEYLSPELREFVFSYISEPAVIAIGISLIVLSIIFTVCHNIVCEDKNNQRMRVIYWFCWNICSLTIIVKLVVMLLFSVCWIVLPTIFYYLPNKLFASKPKPEYTIKVEETYDNGWYCGTRWRGTKLVDKQVSESEYMIWKTNNLIDEIDNLKKRR